jgi:hypothetical protein
VILLGLTAFDYSCSKPAEEVLTGKQNYWIDTVFYSIQDSLDIEMDSICELRKDQYFKLASDSIRNVRLKEIESLIGN